MFIFSSIPETHSHNQTHLMDIFSEGRVNKKWKNKMRQSKANPRGIQSTVLGHFIRKWPQPPICTLISARDVCLSHALQNIIRDMASIRKMYSRIRSSMYSLFAVTPQKYCRSGSRLLGSICKILEAYLHFDEKIKL